MLVREEERVLCLDHYEHGIVVHALNALRNDLIGEKRPTDAVDELLLKTIDAPIHKNKRRSHHETR
jgi:hypothetical protein